MVIAQELEVEFKQEDDDRESSVMPKRLEVSAAW